MVGAATRSVTECLRVGRDDLSTLTSYLDGRFLVGDPALFAELDREVRAYLKEHAEEFIAAKLAEQAKRHEGFGESLYLLQPNLKESVGGLRDFHTALWVARAALWEVRRAEHLRVQGFIDADEERELLVGARLPVARAQPAPPQGPQGRPAALRGAGAARRVPRASRPRIRCAGSRC